MLSHLRLNNIGFIDSLELSFEKGFTVFTGETGAGKSIFLDAIDLLLGGLHSSSSSRLMQDGNQSCLIEGSFKINSLVKNWLDQNNFDCLENHLSILREWKYSDNQKWKSRIKLNNQAVSRQQILKLRPYLIDFTLQGNGNQLSFLNSQTKLLDRLGSLKVEKALVDVKNSWNDWKLAFDNLEKAKVEYNDFKIHYEENKKILEELELAQIEDPLEENSLKEEEDRLVHGVRLQQSIHLIFNQIKESAQDIPSALDNISICIKELKVISELDNSLKPQLEIGLDLYANLQDLISQLEEYYLLLESEPGKLNIVQERRSFLKNLQTKYGLDLEQLILRRDSLRGALISQDLESSLEELKVNEECMKRKRDKSNQILSKLRYQAARDFETSLVQYMKLLGLSNAAFRVQITSCLPTNEGADEVVFLFSANPGQILAPLTEIASGGEISRFLLALKAIFSEIDGSSTLVFDEIDSGVSGRISSSIANVLRQLSVDRQVFCVTHQPLVAAVADHHFSISKVSKKDSTSSKVKQLKGFEERQRELAELAGGDFEEASIYAKSLLQKKAA